jgi:drug/metabolite transporter (DMT)-like permease
MNWIWIILGAAVCNAYWTSAAKERSRADGFLLFTASLRWGVVILLLPVAWGHWHDFSWRWWIAGAVSGLLESLGVWTLARGALKDYYSTFAFSNVAPIIVVFLSFWMLGETVTLRLLSGVLLVVAGSLWLYWNGHGSWWGFSSAVCAALSGIASKWVIAESGFAPHACYSFAVGALATTLWGMRSEGFCLPDLWRVARPNAGPILGSYLATLGYFAALAMAPYNQVSALFRFNMVAGFFLSVYVLGETKRLKSRAFGAFLILAGVVLVAWKP